MELSEDGEEQTPAVENVPESEKMEYKIAASTKYNLIGNMKAPVMLFKETKSYNKGKRFR